MADIDYILSQLDEHYNNKIVNSPDEDADDKRLSTTEYYTYWGILKSVPEIDLAQVEEIVDAKGYASILSYVAKKVLDAELPVYKRNESLDVLLARYVDKKSRRVGESRKEIIDRFEHLSFTEQKRVVKAFLNSNSVADMEWAARAADKRWDRSYEELLKNAFDKTGSDTLALSVIHHMPADYLKSRESQLVMYFRSEYCIRFPEEADELMKKYDFNIFEMLYVKARIGQRFQISDLLVERRFFRFIYTFAQKSLFGIYRGYTNVGDIPWLGRALQSLGVLGYRQVLMQFLRMNDYAVERHMLNDDRTELYYVQKWIIKNYFPEAEANEPVDECKVREGIERFTQPKLLKIMSKEDLDQYDDLPPDILDAITDFI